MISLTVKYDKSIVLNRRILVKNGNLNFGTLTGKLLKKQGL